VNKAPSAIGRSLAFRIPPIVYRRLLGMAPHPRVERRESTGWPLLTMTGRRHLTMTVEMLRSVGRAWCRQPELILVGDGSVNAEDLRRAVSWWPQKVTIRLPDYYRDAAAALGRTDIVDFSRAHVFGIKVAAMLQEAREGRVLWCDTDFLFWGDLLACSDVFENPALPLYTAEDWMRAYDEDLAATVSSELERIPNVNSGLCWMSGDIYAEARLGPELKLAAKHCSLFTEQTLFAVATARCGKVLWTRKMIRLGDSDQFSLRMHPQWPTFVARHYLTPHRHLFWRDAMAFRMRGLPREVGK
jgi:hypothetical protein